MLEQAFGLCCFAICCTALTHLYGPSWHRLKCRLRVLAPGHARFKLPVNVLPEFQHGAAQGFHVLLDLTPPFNACTIFAVSILLVLKWSSVTPWP